MDVHIATSAAPQLTSLATHRRELVRPVIVLHQDHVRDVVLAAHRQARAMPREACRVVVPPELPEPAPQPRGQHLKVPLRTAGPLQEQATTA